MRFETAVAPIFAVFLAAQLIVGCQPPGDEEPAAGSQPPEESLGTVAAREYANTDVLVDTEWVLANQANADVHLIDLSSRPEV